MSRNHEQIRELFGTSFSRHLKNAHGGSTFVMSYHQLLKWIRSHNKAWIFSTAMVDKIFPIIFIHSINVSASRLS